jgi:hypothetical protein
LHPQNLHFRQRREPRSVKFTSPILPLYAPYLTLWAPFFPFFFTHFALLGHPFCPSAHPTSGHLARGYIISGGGIARFAPMRAGASRGHRAIRPRASLNIPSPTPTPTPTPTPSPLPPSFRTHFRPRPEPSRRRWLRGGFFRSKKNFASVTKKNAKSLARIKHPPYLCGVGRKDRKTRRQQAIGSALPSLPFSTFLQSVSP